VAQRTHDENSSSNIGDLSFKNVAEISGSRYQLQRAFLPDGFGIITRVVHVDVKHLRDISVFVFEVAGGQELTKAASFGRNSLIHFLIHRWCSKMVSILPYFEHRRWLTRLLDLPRDENP
jgi:hypothetical protein